MWKSLWFYFLKQRWNSDAFSGNCRAILGFSGVTFGAKWPLYLGNIFKASEKCWECDRVPPPKAPNNQANLGNNKHRSLFCFTFFCFWSQFHDFWGAGSGFLTHRSWLCYTQFTANATLLFAIHCVLSAQAPDHLASLLLLHSEYRNMLLTLAGIFVILVQWKLCLSNRRKHESHLDRPIWIEVEQNTLLPSNANKRMTLLSATIQIAEIESASAGKRFRTGETSFPGRKLK